MQNVVIFPIIFFFLNTSPAPEVQFKYSDGVGIEIYFIKQRWHTAIVFNTSNIDTNNFPIIKNFRDYNLVDIGWGDEEFYQYPDFDWELAIKALFYSTPSTLRVEGISISRELYFDLSEIVVKMIVTDEQFKEILKFIDDTFYRDEKGEKVLSSKAGGQIIFYAAKGKYHLFNTCNTWLAKCLNDAGLKIKTDIILTEQLFNELAKIGEVIKAER
ncbi:Putative outer membrane lipoprotein [Ignavibacterium album JCM 16511]|uniref:Putative outer membrane lipoprotein n=2 Tax=Ignavibacterium album TaxID=591197 RepID=I0AMX7_IGNAJ|nr:Putative outer membrane lipoprotein [Ignavibacterium album JCM 16511]